MKGTKFCQINGHEMNSAIHICTFKECNSTNKWVCFECTLNLHQHGGLNQNHIMNKQQFLQFPIKQLQTQGDQIKQRISLLMKQIKELDQFIQNMVLIKQQLELDLKTVTQQYNSFDFEKLVETAMNDYLLLDNQQLNQIMNIFYNPMQPPQQTDLVIQLIDQNKQLQQLFQVTSIEIEYLNEKNSHFKYEDFFEYKSKDTIFTSQISYDEKYLIIGDYNMLQVYHIQSKCKIRSIELSYYANICEFSNDSKYLFCGDSAGYLYCYACNQDFKQIYKQRIHQDCIKSIKYIGNYQAITCSRDQSIISTNLKQNRQELFINQAGFVLDLDFDYQRNVIISCTSNNVINFYNKNDGIIIFSYKNAHKDHIQKIQFIPQNNSLLSSDFQQLILWHLNYDQQTLIQIKSLDLENYNFTSIYNANCIILINQKCVQILDNDLNMIESIDHSIFSLYYNKFYTYFLTKQLDSLKYIIIPGRLQIQVMKLCRDQDIVVKNSKM